MGLIRFVMNENEKGVGKKEMGKQKIVAKMP